jgi:protein-tyrosine phosphatase
MVDVHHHLLFGLDDGSPDLETSVAMARAAVADGITHVVATPHASSRYSFDPELVAERMTTLREELAAQAVELTVGQGCDFHLSYDNVQDAFQHPRKYTINAHEYLLIELHDYAVSPNLGETLYELRMAGMTPILTHPERNPMLQRDPDRMMDWMRNGLLVQVTASSVLGEMGRAAERMAHKLLEDRWVHFLATDAHNVTHRPPQMAAARDWVAKRHGAAYAERITQENPLAVFEGRPLGEQDEARNLFDEDEGAALPWWKRMFKR